jgi:hypothetical protein
VVLAAQRRPRRRVDGFEQDPKLTWEQVYRDKGLHWELINSRGHQDGSNIYSLRITRKFRALARREGQFLELLSLHPDHDSAYH